MEEERLKLAVISGASQAVKYKEKNPRATSSEIIQHVTDKVEEILEKIYEGEEV
ncbi:hypothetical protein HYV50_02450 [Candidatus Pacearchaeota archaeon]|nr:hypothetical protein [Candidatus Pacearchaeota archaeon]